MIIVSVHDGRLFNKGSLRDKCLISKYGIRCDIVDILYSLTEEVALLTTVTVSLHDISLTT